MTEFELFQLLRPRYPKREYALLPQVANGTGFAANRHADAIALSLWPSRGLHLHGFEIKSWRGDWIKELRNPEKAEDICGYCNYWWIVAADKSIVQPGELPQTWGLLVYNEKRKQLIQEKAAPFRKPENKPDLLFVAAILRKCQDVATPDALLEEYRQAGLAQGREEGEKHGTLAKEKLERLETELKAFEKASGISINEWKHGQQIGEAVRLVLSGAESRYSARLVEVAESILRDLKPVSMCRNPSAAQDDERSKA